MRKKVLWKFLVLTLNQKHGRIEKIQDELFLNIINYLCDTPPPIPRKQNKTKQFEHIGTILPGH